MSYAKFSFLSVIIFLLSLSCSPKLKVDEVDSWLNTSAGNKSPTVNLAGKWIDNGGGWGEGNFEQKDKNIFGILGVYIIKGIVSGNSAHLAMIYGGSVYYTATFDLKNDNELIGYYYSSRDRKQSRPSPIVLYRTLKMASLTPALSTAIAFQTLKSQPSLPLDFDRINKAVITIKTNEGHGSGFIINSEGYAITNYHVIKSWGNIVVLLKGGKPIPADLIRVDEKVDLALIKLAGDEYDFLPLGNSTKAKTGNDVYAIGTPQSLGLPNSVSKGIISGVRIIKDPEITLLQTDAPISPGNSGGPLINIYGEVVGVNQSKIIGLKIEGVAFAISIDAAKKYLNLREKTE